MLPYRFFEDQKKIDERLQRARKMTQENRLTELVRYDDYKGSLLLILVVPVPLLDPCSAVDLFIVDLFIADLSFRYDEGDTQMEELLRLLRKLHSQAQYRSHEDYIRITYGLHKDYIRIT